MLDIWGIKLYGYGLMIGLAVLAAWEVSLRYGKVSKEVINKVAFGVIFAGIVGARAYHIVDFWSYYQYHFAEIFYLWNGGLGIWGAILGGGLYALYVSKKEKVDTFLLLDSMVLGLPLAQAIGRVGNYINKELYGKNGEPLFAWEGGLNLILFTILITVNKFSKKTGIVSGIYFVGYGVIRIILENFRPDNSIWRVGDVPVAVLLGVISVAIGLTLILHKKKLPLRKLYSDSFIRD